MFGLVFGCISELHNHHNKNAHPRLQLKPKKNNHQPKHHTLTNLPINHTPTHHPQNIHHRATHLHPQPQQLHHHIPKLQQQPHIPNLHITINPFPNPTTDQHVRHNGAARVHPNHQIKPNTPTATKTQNQTDLSNSSKQKNTATYIPHTHTTKHANINTPYQVIPARRASH